MSKKVYLLILIFSLFVIGYLHNLFYPTWILSVPIINYIFLYGFPIIMVCFWFWVGGQFAQNNIKVITSMLIGNSIGIVSLLVFLWQFVLIPDNQRNILLASLSQHFSSFVIIFTGKIAILFEPEKNVVGSVTFQAMQILGLLFMIIIFTIGYYYKKNKIYNVNSEGA